MTNFAPSQVSISEENKALYTAALVADGWAGAENLGKKMYYKLSDGQTDGSKSGLKSRVSATKKNVG